VRPPVKWSYLKVIGWSVLVFLGFGWTVFYVNTVTTNAATVISTPLTIFGSVSVSIFVSLLFFIWRHNHTVYAQRYAQWDQSFICLRCGDVTQQQLQDRL